MKTAFDLYVRAFPLVVEDQRTGDQRSDLIVLDKQQLQAAQLVGQSSKELIHRLAERQGLTVLEIGKPEKREISLNLEELYRLHKGAVRVGE